MSHTRMATLTLILSEKFKSTDILLYSIHLSYVVGPATLKTISEPSEALLTTGDGMTIKVLRCEHCGKCCPSRGALNIHNLSHSELRQFTCMVCQKSFKLKHHLKKHMLLHSSN